MSRLKRSNACHENVLRGASPVRLMATAHEVIMSKAPIAIIGTGI
ncbi:MAG TPA: FAD-dependent oxidoreductase, partial [Pseudomonas sp.]|nr:FAD-dependent oxidoreductase [Pseudomonas sp.]